MMTTDYNANTACGVIGGTLASIRVTQHMESVTETIVLSLIGAVVSFIASYLLEAVFRRTRQDR